MNNFKKTVGLALSTRSGWVLLVIIYLTLIILVPTVSYGILIASLGLPYWIHIVACFIGGALVGNYILAKPLIWRQEVKRELDKSKMEE